MPSLPWQSLRVVLVWVVLGLVAVGAVIFMMKRSDPMDSIPPAANRPSGNGSQREHWLIGKEGEVAGKDFHVGARTITIGRTPQNFVQLTGSGISRNHCQLRPHGDTLQLTDMKSENATYLNGEKVSSALLKAGDLLKIGDVVFEYQRAWDGVNAALSAKIGGKAMNKSTVEALGGDEGLIAKAIADSGGDLAKAAQALGIDEAKLRALIEDG